MTPSVPALLLGSVVGAALGSFAVTVGLRWAQGQSALAGRSRCDGCARALGFGETIPIVSFAWLGGACRSCGARIDRAHLVGEVTGAGVVALSLFSATPMRAALIAALGLVLIAASAADSRVRRLPDASTFLVATLALGLALMQGPWGLTEGLAAAAVVVGLLLAVRWMRDRARGEPGLGLGDVKLWGALALWLGLATPWAVALAAVVGLLAMAIVRPADGRLAFGPAIALAAWSVGLAREAGAWLTTA